MSTNMSSPTTDLINVINSKYGFSTAILLLILGSISNLLLIFIFLMLPNFQGNQCAFFLTVESISNIGLILINFIPYFLNYTIGHDSALDSLAWCKLQRTLSQTFGICSLYTICFLAFEQFISTNPRHQWRRIGTLKLAHYLVALNVCFAILQSIPLFIWVTITPTLGCTISYNILHTYFTYFYYPILSMALPLIITITFSFLAYRNVRRIVRRQIPIVRRRLDHQLTAMVLARVVSLIVCGLPYIAYRLYVINISTANSSSLKLAVVNLIGSFAYSLLYATFAINFYLFYIVSSRFRHQVKHFFKRIFHRNATNRRFFRSSNQVVPENPPGTVSIVESV